MAVSISVPLSIVNFNSLPLSQYAPEIVALPTGGYLVGWQDNAGPRLQRFDATGAPVGAAVQLVTFALLQDLLVFNNQVLVLSGAGQTLNLRVLSSDLSETFIIQSVTVLDGVGSAALAVTPAGGYVDIYVKDFYEDVRLYSFFNGGLVGDGQIVESLPQPGGNLMDVAPFSSSTNWMLHENGIISTSSFNAFFWDSSLNFGAMLQLADGLVLLSVNRNGTVPSLVAINGFNNDPAINFISPEIIPFSIAGNPGTGPLVVNSRMVDLGDGRIMMIWGAYSGTGNVFNQTVNGIYAQVYDIRSGMTEGPSILVRAMATLIDLDLADVDATLMSDGRVAITLVLSNGLTFLDVFTTVLDPRITGVTIAATSAADQMVGSAFDDTFTNANTGDSIDGGTGSDTVVFTASVARSLDLEKPDAFGNPQVLLTSVENLTLGNLADVAFGNAAANNILGNNGNDVLDGRGGNDSLSGGTGTDRLIGGDGDDTLLGLDDNDILVGHFGRDLLLGGSGADTQMGGAENDTLNGGAGADSLNGGDGDDVIFGGNDNDRISALLGNDSVFGDAGNDAIFTSADNTATVDGGDGVDTVFARGRFFSTQEGAGGYFDLSGEIEDFAAELGFVQDGNLLVSIENLVGTEARDFIAGSAGANVLNGAGGDDILIGRAGADTLRGGDGADSFLFRAGSDGGDRIVDFNAAADRIGLQIDGFGDIDASNFVSRFVVNASGSAVGSSVAQITFDNSGAGAGNLILDTNGNLSGGTILLGRLFFTDAAGLAGFTADDFFFF